MSYSDQRDDSYRAVVPEGTHLAWSRDTEGAKRALLFEDGTNKLIGPPELIQAEDEYEYEYEYEPEARPMTPEEMEAALQGVVILATVLFRLVELTVVAVDTKVAPRIRIWWAEKGRPRLKKIWDKRRRDVAPAVEEPSQKGPRSRGEVIEFVDSRKSSPEEFSNELQTVLETYKASMSGAEAHERRLAISLAEAFIAEQKRKLSEARIEDYDYFFELNRAMTQLEARRVPDSINLILESSFSEREERPSIELPDAHKEGQSIQRAELPVEIEVAKRDFLLAEDGTEYILRAVDPEFPSGTATTQE